MLIEDKFLYHKNLSQYPVHKIKVNKLHIKCIVFKLSKLSKQNNKLKF